MSVVRCTNQSAQVSRRNLIQRVIVWNAKAHCSFEDRDVDNVVADTGTCTARAQPLFYNTHSTFERTQDLGVQCRD